MTKNQTSLSNSVVKDCDRTSDGNLKPEAKERILKSVKKYLEQTGRANISEIAQMINLSRPTTKNLINEILLEWNEDIQDQTFPQSKWIESVIKDLDENPETFDKEKRANINLKTGLLSKLNALQKLALKDDSYGFIVYKLKATEPKKLPDAKPPP